MSLRKGIGFCQQSEKTPKWCLYSRKYKFNAKEIKNKLIKTTLLFFFICLLKVKTLIIPIYARQTIHHVKIT